MVKYSNTGKFTEKQIKLAKEISKKINELKRTGCEIYAKNEYLEVYKAKDMEHAQPQHLICAADYEHPIKNINCGRITDCGGDDMEFFEKGYIDGE